MTRKHNSLCLGVYRQYVGPAHISGKRVISNEMGAVLLKAYQIPLPELLGLVKRAWAAVSDVLLVHAKSEDKRSPDKIHACQEDPRALQEPSVSMTCVLCKS